MNTKNLRRIIVYILILFPVWTIILTFAKNPDVVTGILIVPLILPFLIFLIFLSFSLWGFLIIFFGGISGYAAGVLTKELFQKTWLAILVGYWVFAQGIAFCSALLNILGLGLGRFPG